MPAGKRANVPSDRKRVLWLLAFLRRDFSRMKPSDLQRVFRGAVDHLHLVHGAFGLVAPSALFSDEELQEELAALTEGRSGTPLMTEAARRILGRLQRRLRAGLDALGNGEVWRPFEEGEGAPRWVMVRQSDGTLRRDYEGKWIQISIGAAADALMRWWPQLRRCPRCKTWFLPTHGKQQYCSPECSQQTRYEKWAAHRNHKQEMIRRHELEKERERTRTRRAKGAR